MSKKGLLFRCNFCTQAVPEYKHMECALMLEEDAEERKVACEKAIQRMEKALSSGEAKIKIQELLEYTGDYYA